MPKFNFCPVCGADMVLQALDERERLACSADASHYIHYDNPKPVVAAIVEYEGEILLARNAKWPPSWYALITGFLEANESPEDAVKRELMEEIGLDAEVQGLVGVYPFFRMNEVIIAYHVKAIGEVKLGDEIVDVKKVPKAQLIPWPYATGDAVRDWLRQQGILANVDKTLSFK
jgi:NADH pyrophosphatase NudC (nudix superfamily)